MNFSDANRPVLILGSGIHLAGAAQEARELVDLLKIPVALTWGAADILPESCPYRIGTFGTHGTRAANFAVQNADFILSIGSRLDTKATGTPAHWFARAAHIVMVDIDASEIAKMAKVGVKVEGVCEDVSVYISDFMNWSGGTVWPDWLARCQDWKRRYPPVLPEYEHEEGVNPYVLIRELSRHAHQDDIIVTDTGCAVAWMCQAWEFKAGQRLLHSWNQTPMGYALPAAVGAHYATGRRIICVVGDGALMMSVGELATIAGHKLNIKIVVLSNAGHGMCRASEREWMDGEYCATSTDSGLTFPPSFAALARAHGMRAWKLETIRQSLAALMARSGNSGPTLLEVAIASHHDVKPKIKAGKPNEDGYPYLPRDVLEDEMIVPLP